MSEELSSGAAPVEAAQSEQGLGSPQGSPEAVIQAADGSTSQAVQENVETLQEQVKEAVADGASKKEIQNLIKEFELKVNGKTVKSKIDLSDDEAVKRELQKAYAFNDVSQENAQIKKALSAKIASWKANPAQALADLGIDANDFSVNHLDKQIEESRKTPEQKAQEEKDQKLSQYEARLAEYEEKERRIQEMLQKQQQDSEQAELRNSLIAEIDGAIAKSSILTQDQDTQRRLADLMHFYSEKYPDREITAEMVMPQLEKQVKAETKKNSSRLSEDELLESIPKEKLEKLLKKLAEKSAPVAEKPKPSIPSQTAANSPVVSKNEKNEAKSKRSFEDVQRMRY